MSRHQFMGEHTCKAVVNGVFRGDVLAVSESQPGWGTLISWTVQDGLVNQPRASLTDLLQG